MHNAVPVLLFLAILYLFTGFFVFLRNPRGLTTSSFLVMMVATSAWSAGMAGFFYFSDIELARITVIVFYIAALLMNTSLLVFTIAFLKYQVPKLLSFAPWIVWGAFSILLTVRSDLFLSIAEIDGQRFDVLLNEFPYFVYTVIVLGPFFGAAYLFHRKLRRSEGIQSQQIRLILIGLYFSGVFATTFNVILPWLGNYRHVWSGPIFILFFLSVVTFAMIRHHLFDVTAKVIRSILYHIIYIFLAAALLIGILAISSSVLANTSVNANTSLLLISFGVTLIPALKLMRKILGNITNRIFYRKGYEPQTTLGNLASMLSREFKLYEILRLSSELLSKTIQSEKLEIIVFDELGNHFESYITPSNLRRTAIMSQDIDGSIVLNHHDSSELSHKMNKYNLEIILRIESNQQSVGAILVGNKKSGGGYSNKDLRFLQVAANNLGLALQNARYYEEVSQFADKLQEEVDQATKKLKQSNKQLKELNRSKDEFLSMTSHQLRPQLTAARGFLAMIGSDTSMKTQERNELVDLSTKSLDRMARVLSDLLNMTRLQEGKFSIFTERTDLIELVRSEVASFQSAAQKKQIDLQLRLDHKKLSIDLDWIKIREVLFNFIDNAIQYTEEDGKITVGIKSTNKEVAVTVTDTGIGVPKKSHKKMFTKFYRAKNAETMRPSGTGIGLYVAKEVISAHGGEIIFESEEGKGSTFGFKLPRGNLKNKASN